MGPTGASLPSVSEWRASTFDGGRQDQASIDAGEGVIYTAWASDKPRWGVYGQRFNANGKALGRETGLSLWPEGMQAAPSVAAIPGGGAWVAWQSWGQDGDSGAIIARRFGRDFAAGSSEVLVNQDTAGDQRSPVVAVAPNGTAAFAWASSGDEGPAGLRARLFDASGAPLCDEFGIGDGEAGSVRTASIAAAADGTFAVAYAAFDAQEHPASIRVMRFDSTGRRLGDPVTVSRAAGVEPSIAATTAGFVAAWIDTTSDGDDYGVLTRQLDGQGLPLGDAFVANRATAGPQTGATVSATANGGFAIAWNGPGGVFVRAFDSGGQAAEDEVAVKGEGDRAMRVAAGTRRLASVGERLVCVWSGQVPETEEEAREHAGGGDPDAGGAVGVSMLAYDGFDGRGVRQGVREGMRPARGASGHAGLAEPHRPPVFDPKKIDRTRRHILRDGLGFDAVINTGWTPPDPHMAVGPNHIICMTNGAIRFFLKNGGQTFADKIEGPGGFWGGLGDTSFVFDPECLYDELSGRFFAMAAEGYEPGDKSHVLIAVSDDSDPNGTWYKYRIETTALAGNLFDSPNIGVTDDAVIITGDGFGHSANYPVYIFDKASMLVGNPPQVSKSLTMQTSTQSAGMPPVSFDSPPAVYFIEHKEGNNLTQVRLAALTNALTNPQFTFFTLTVPTYGAPIDPPQQGTSARVSTFDARFWNVAYRKGSLWATQHVNIAGRTLARWYEVHMNGWPKSGKDPELAQSGNIDPGTGVWTTFSAITADADGTAAMVFARSASTEPYTMATAYRLACDAPGTFRAPESQHATTGPYSQGRWGDYGSVEADPAEPGKFWAIHEYAINDSWRAWIAPVTALGCPPDLTCDGTLDLFDFLAFQNLFNTQDPRADCDGSGVFDLFDFLCYLNLFNGGC